VLHHLRFWLLAVLLVITAGPAWAQPRQMRRSHVPIEGGIAPGLADEYLRDRFQQVQTTAEMERLIGDLVNHPGKLGIGKDDQATLRNALQQAGGQPAKALVNPDVQRILADAAQKRGDQLSISEAQRQQLKELARCFIDPAEFERLSASKPGGLADPTPANGTEPATEPLPQTPPLSPAPAAGAPSEDPPTKSVVTDRLRDIADALADSPLAESPAFRRMVVNIERVKTPRAPEFVTWDQRLGQLEERIGAVRARLPGVSWPQTKGSPPTPVSSLPAVPPLPDEAPGGSSEVVFVCLAAATAGGIAWGLLRRRGLLNRRLRDPDCRLGPWPVQPATVGTRYDLVRAFEYLALSRLGAAARNQNHLEIAAGLGAADAGRRGAAKRLATLYEQARYAPPEEELPASDLALARAALSLLAGGSAP
jgi:hypothetical protein